MLILLATACASTPEPVGAPAALYTTAQPGQEARARKIEALLASGRVFAAQHRPAEAEAQLRQAVQLSWGFGSPWADYHVDALSLLARCVLAQGRGAEARALIDDALPLAKPGTLANDQRIAELETTRAESLLGEKQANLAVAPFTRALAASARHSAALAPTQIGLSLRLAETLQGLGQFQDAKKVLQRALAVAQQEPAGRALLPRVQQAVAASNAPAATPNAEASAPGIAANEMVAMQADFRACYRAANENHADVAGRVALVLSIAADGHVSNVKADASGLPVSAVDCLKRRASLARFEPPKGGEATITVPVTFVKQEND